MGLHERRTRDRGIIMTDTAIITYNRIGHYRETFHNYAWRVDIEGECKEFRFARDAYTYAKEQGCLYYIIPDHPNSDVKRPIPELLNVI